MYVGNEFLVNTIRASIQTSSLHAICFRDFMHNCLYHEQYGYYRIAKPKIGKEGDFYTSSSIGSIMGEMLAAYLIKEMKALPAENCGVQLVEWGGGTGKLCLHILNEIANLEPHLYAQLEVVMIESSSYQRSLQEIQLASHESKITWMDPKEWKQRQHSHIQFVIANELLDAFAVHRVRLSSSGYLECYVGWNEEIGEFTEVWLELTDADVWAYLAAEQLSLQVGQIIEVNLQAHEWIREVSETMTMGQLIVIDYGDITEQLWTSSRRRGTLLCYRNHVAHDQFYSFCGEQDITAHVNFSACLRTAQASGFTDLSYKTQRQFLVEQGILDRLQNHEDPNPFSEVAKKNRSIRQLLISDQMSELFKVLVMKKDSVQKTESK